MQQRLQENNNNEMSLEANEETMPNDLDQSKEESQEKSFLQVGKSNKKKSHSFKHNRESSSIKSKAYDDMMFYTGEDLTKSHRLKNVNNLAYLNERKFNEMRHVDDENLSANQNKLLHNGQVFYHETNEGVGVPTGESPKNNIFSTEDAPNDNNTRIGESQNSVQTGESLIDKNFQTGELLSDKNAQAGESQNDQNPSSPDNVKKKGKLVRGLKSVDDPNAISFQEQTEWLNKLVEEEIKSQEVKKQKEISPRTDIDIIDGQQDGIDEEPRGLPEPIKMAVEEAVSNDIEDSSIDLQSRRDWLENLSQKDLQNDEPTATQLSARVDNLLGDLVTLTSEAVDQQDIYNTKDGYDAPSSTVEGSKNIRREVSIEQGDTRMITKVTVSSQHKLIGSDMSLGNSDDIHDEYEQQGVKERMKLFQEQFSTDDVIRTQNKDIQKARPKSYHFGQMTDYRYTGNDYDSSTFYPISPRPPQEQIKIVSPPASPRTPRTKSENGGRYNEETIEYKYCVKDTRILREIEETENREREYRESRSHLSNNNSNNATSFHRFLSENELR